MSDFWLSIIGVILLLGLICVWEGWDQNAADNKAREIGGTVDREISGATWFYHYYVRDKNGKRIDLNN